MNPTLKRLLFWLLIPALAATVLALRFLPAAQAMGRDFLSPFLAARHGAARALQPLAPESASRSELLETVRELQGRLEVEQLRGPELERLRRENEQLRRILRVTPSPGLALVVAEVLSRDPASGGRRLLLGRGEADGIQAGQAVLAEGRLLGRILNASRHSAEVITLLDRSCRVSVSLPGNRAEGVLSGRDGNAWSADPYCQLDYLPRDLQYAEGQEVVTSAFGQQVPAGIPVGRTQAMPGRPLVENVDNLYRRLTVKPFASAGDLAVVSVLVPPPAPAAP